MAISATPQKVLDRQSFHFSSRGGELIQCPSNKHRGHTHIAPPRTPGAAREADNWRLWTELTVRLSGLPKRAGTLDLHNLLSPYGYIQSINLEENDEGSRNGAAVVTFCPPPNEPFWGRWPPNNDTKWARVRIQKQHRKRTFRHPSPVNSSKTYPEHQVSCLQDLSYIDGADMYIPS